MSIGTKDCRHGKLSYLINDAYIGRSLDVYGEYSEGELELFRQFLRPGDVAADIGANIGALTVGMARLVAPGGAVVAFEPQRTIFEIGYRLWWHITPLFNPDNFFRYPRDIFGDVVSFNMIGFPRRDPPAIQLPEILSPDDFAGQRGALARRENR